jgi:iron complex transport system ATP-binding protein
VTTTHTLEVEDLRLAYGGRVVIESLDLLVPPGKVTAIVGANACGKSTLLRALARLLAPQRGRVALDGKDLHRMPNRWPVPSACSRSHPSHPTA